MAVTIQCNWRPRNLWQHRWVISSLLHHPAIHARTIWLQNQRWVPLPDAQGSRTGFSWSTCLWKPFRSEIAFPKGIVMGHHFWGSVLCCAGVLPIWVVYCDLQVKGFDSFWEGAVVGQSCSVAVLVTHPCSEASIAPVWLSCLVPSLCLWCRSCHTLSTIVFFPPLKISHIYPRFDDTWFLILSCKDTETDGKGAQAEREASRGSFVAYVPHCPLQHSF